VGDLLQRLQVWLVIAAVVGLATGFTVGRLGLGNDEDGSAGPLPDRPELLPETTTTTTTAPPRPATIACSGGIPQDLQFTAVVGVVESGAARVAAALEVDPVVERPFGELVGGGFETFRNEVLALAGEGPVLFVARLSSGPLQKDLSRQLQEAAPGSATVIADPDGGAPVEGLAQFAPPAAIVPLDPALPESWVQEVAAIANGDATCPEPGAPPGG
jgi:hypothetical protein